MSIFQFLSFSMKFQSFIFLFFFFHIYFIPTYSSSFSNIFYQLSFSFQPFRQFLLQPRRSKKFRSAQPSSRPRPSFRTSSSWPRSSRSSCQSSNAESSSEFFFRPSTSQGVLSRLSSPLLRTENELAAVPALLQNSFKKKEKSFFFICYI